MLFFDIIKKVVLKFLVLFTLIILTLFNSILKVSIFVFGIAAIPIGTGLSIIAIIIGCMEGFGSESMLLFGIAAVLIGLKYLFPIIPKSLDIVKFTLKEYLYEPIIVRSPVKYTI